MFVISRFFLSCFTIHNEAKNIARFTEAFFYMEVRCMDQSSLNESKEAPLMGIKLEKNVM